MKKYRVGMIMAVFAFIAMLPLRVSAEETTKEIGVTCTPNEDKTEYSVDLYIPNAAKEEIGTLSLKLEVTPKEVVGEPQIQFSGKVKEWAKVYESRYHNTLNIYIAGTKEIPFNKDNSTLFENDDTLNIGKISMKGSDGKAVELSEVKLANAEDALLVVRGWGDAEAPNRETWIPEQDEPAGPEIPTPPGKDDEGDGDGDLGGSIDIGGSTAKDQYDKDRDLKGSRVQGVKTGDANQTVIYVVSIAACIGVISAAIYRKRKKTITE